MKNYAAMAELAVALKADRRAVDRLLRSLERARDRRNAHALDALEAGMTWRDAAAYAGLSTVQLGKIVRQAKGPARET